MNEAKVTLGRVAIEGSARGFEFFSVTPDTDLADQYVPAEIADAMLAALRQVQAWNIDGDRDDLTAWAEMTDAVNAAIRKATGEVPA